MASISPVKLPSSAGPGLGLGEAASFRAKRLYSEEGEEDPLGAHPGAAASTSAEKLHSSGD